MDSSILNDGLHYQLIPQYREQSATYGISSSSSVHPPPPIDPVVFWHHHPPLPSPPQDTQMVVTFPYPSLPVYTCGSTHDDSAPPSAREKKHCCQLCFKRFDRPSTLKKHLLVHTGEKAWACEICHRRFSVSSNLNRHTRRCKEKWVKADGSAADTPTSTFSSEPSDRTDSPPSSSTSSDGFDAPHLPPPQLTDRPKRRQSTPGVIRYETDDGTSRSHDQQHVTEKPHKRRRKGSPSEPWIPPSLVSFNLDPITRSVPTPLPAVVPSTFEERNSYDDTPLQAYHPSCWTGRLVGPSYTQRNEEVSRGRFYGKLLVF